jgi:DNA-3-methyladenine glycosylase
MLFQALQVAFYGSPTALVARKLLGKIVARRTREGLCAGRIVETEAYLGTEDEASHTFRGRTARNGSMFGRPGIAYVYRIHQVHCLNVVTEGQGIGRAVLIRAMEPIQGIALMQQRTGKELDHHIARGPGLLCRALDIDLALDGWDMTLGRKLWISEGEDLGELAIATSARIGISKAKEMLLRFYLENSRFVSGKRQGEIRHFP